jgi:hypothetical protein
MKNARALATASDAESRCEKFIFYVSRYFRSRRFRRTRDSGTIFARLPASHIENSDSRGT